MKAERAKPGRGSTKSQLCSALANAASSDHLEVCLLLISRRANLMLATCRTVLDRYGEDK